MQGIASREMEYIRFKKTRDLCNIYGSIM